MGELYQEERRKDGAFQTEYNNQKDFDHASYRPFLRHFHQDVFSQSEHGVPHFHAVYGEYNAVFDIVTLEMMEGDLPSRAHKLVKEWASEYKNELLHMWQTNEFKQLPGLE